MYYQRLNYYKMGNACFLKCNDCNDVNIEKSYENDMSSRNFYIKDKVYRTLSLTGREEKDLEYKNINNVYISNKRQKPKINSNQRLNYNKEFFIQDTHRKIIRNEMIEVRNVNKINTKRKKRSKTILIQNMENCEEKNIPNIFKRYRESKKLCTIIEKDD